MSEIAKRDANRVAVGMAATDDSDESPMMIRVDSTTKRLVADIAKTTVPGTSNDPTGKRDENYVPTVYAVTDDANQDVVPVGVDSDGFILADVNIE